MGSAPGATEAEHFLAMVASLFRIPASCAVNGSEITMRVDHLRLKAQGRFKSEHGAFGITKTSQRDAEIEMSHRQSMQKTYSAQRAVDRLLILSHSPIGGRKTEKSVGVVFVECKRFFECRDGILQLRKPQVGLAELEINTRILRRCCFRFQQGPQRPTEIAARQLHSRPKKLATCRIGLAGVRHGAKQTLRLSQITTLEITARQLVKKAIFPRASPDDLLQRRARRFRLTFPEKRTRDIILAFNFG